MRHQVLDVLFVHGRHRLVATLFARDGAAVAGIEMVLASVAFEHFSGLGDADSFGYRLVGFEFHTWLAFAPDDRRDVAAAACDGLFNSEGIDCF